MNHTKGHQESSPPSPSWFLCSHLGSFLPTTLSGHPTPAPDLGVLGRNLQQQGQIVAVKGVIQGKEGPVYPALNQVVGELFQPYHLHPAHHTLIGPDHHIWKGRRREKETGLPPGPVPTFHNPVVAVPAYFPVPQFNVVDALPQLSTPLIWFWLSSRLLSSSFRS